MIKFFPDTKIFLQIGPLSIAWYAVFIMTGAYIAYIVSAKNLKKAGYFSEDIENVFMGALLSGFLGARLWYVLFYNFTTYLKDPISILRIQDGGLAIQGGLFAGVAFGYWYAKRKNLNFWHWADMVVPNILIAQALGRWGNFMNQEAFGGVVSEGFYKYFPLWFKDMMFIDGAYRMPTFFLESVANIIGWILIVLVLKKVTKLKRGDLVYAYMMWYGVTRFFIEGLRTDSLMFLGVIRIAQLVSVVFVVLGILGFMGVFRKFTKSPKPAILFDFDGTIMDTEDCIVESYKAVFENHRPGYVLSSDELNSFIGPSLVATFSRYFDDHLIDELVLEYRTLNHELHDKHVRPMDGAIELLDALHEEGYPLGIVSNKAYSSLQLGLRQWDMEKYFDVVLGIDDFEIAKPDPKGINDAFEKMAVQRGSSIYVGDAVTDIIAGQRAGSFTIGYVFDKIREQSLIDSEANRVIYDLREILEILKEDHEWTTNMM